MNITILKFEIEQLLKQKNFKNIHNELYYFLNKVVKFISLLEVLTEE